jgi:WD40 repeat protein
MRTRLLILGACVVSSTHAHAPAHAPAQATPRVTTAPNPPLEYSGVYISTPDEDYFTPCGSEGAGDTWSLRFRDNERQAPFLQKVTAVRGYAPLTHFIRVRGRLGPPGSYNLGFQTRELAVDSVLDVKETLEPCAGFGAPAAWNRMPARFSNLKGTALSTDRRLVALMDIDGHITLWSTETGAMVRKLGSVAKGSVEAASYGPMTFSDDGSLLAVGGNDGIVHVWRARDGKRVFLLKLKDSADVAKERAKIPLPKDNPGWTQPLPPNSYSVTSQVIFNRRGTLFATTNLFSTIVWSMKTGKKLAEFDRGNDFMGKIFFVGDEGLLSTADSGRFKLRSCLDAAPVTRPGTRARVTERMTMSPDGRLFAVNGWGDTVFLWSLAEGPGRALPVPAFVTGVIAFSPDGNTIAIAGGNAGLYLYDTRTGAPIRVFHDFPNALFGAWFTADGKAIVTVSHFDDRFRIVYVDATARPAGQAIIDDSLTAKLPLGPPPTTAPRTIGGIVTGPGPNPRAVAGAQVTISDGAAPDVVIARTTTSPGGYFSFNGIRFRHVVIRVRQPGFGPAVKYIHVNRWADEGPWGIELTPDTRPVKSGL